MGAAVSAEVGHQILVWRRNFEGHRERASDARQFVQHVLEDYGNADVVVDVAGELFNNAILYTRSARPGGRVMVELRRWPGSLVSLAITDQGAPNDPEPREPRVYDLEDLDSQFDGGRGLKIVSELADCWGWTGDPSGRTVTALFAL